MLSHESSRKGGRKEEKKNLAVPLALGREISRPDPFPHFPSGAFSRGERKRGGTYFLSSLFCLHPFDRRRTGKEEKGEGGGKKKKPVCHTLLRYSRHDLHANPYKEWKKERKKKKEGWCMGITPMLFV